MATVCRVFGVWARAWVCLMLCVAAAACGSSKSSPPPAAGGSGGSAPVAAAEACGNGLDDDGDGELDCSDPDCLAIVENPTAPVPFAETIEWLYTPAAAECAPLQQDVVDGALVPSRVAVVRGTVAGPDGQPLGGAEIRVAGAPELGRSRSRRDGVFDIAVNGGAKVTLEISAPGLLPVHRRAAVERNGFAWVEPALLVPRSEVVARLNAGESAPLQIAKLEAVEDADGRRAPVVFLPSGTRASALNADGSEQALGSLGVRLTEFTVGDNGPRAMPADLPSSSGYTYAFAVGVDEADELGAEQVRFDQALPIYLENFLGFPAGTPVPVGYYDPQATAWKPEADGLVIAIVGEAAGAAEIDLDGDGTAESAEDLEQAGFGSGETARLAELYEPGQSLWRVQVDHFSTFDLNWGVGLPEDGTAPPDFALPGPLTDKPDCAEGSVLRVDNQTLGEAVALPGTGYALYYQSDRVPGGQRRSLDIEVAGANVPASLKHIEVVLSVAGQRHEEQLAPEAFARFRYAWDGNNAFGRPLQGAQTYTLRVGYAYDGVYTRNENSDGSSFAEPGSVELTGSKSRQEIVAVREVRGSFGGWDARGYGLGGFSLDVHHAYDPAGRTLYYGDGSQRSAETVPPLVTDLFEGTELTGGEPLVRADGSLLFVSGDVIYRLEGTRAAPFAGGGAGGDGGLALDAALDSPSSLTEGPDGSLYFFSNGIRRVDPEGRISTVAGGGDQFVLREGNVATGAEIVSPTGLAVSGDGVVFFGERADGYVWRVTAEGLLAAVAGGTDPTENRPAIGATTFGPSALAFDADGDLYISSSGGNVVRRIDADGLITTVVGTRSAGSDGDGGPASGARVNDPRDIAYDRDGNLVIGQVDGSIRIVDLEGSIDTLVDVGTSGDISVAPDGSIYAGLSGGRIVKVAPSLPRASFGDLVIAAEDGSEIYRFDESGRHLATFDALSNAELRRFEYDAAGRLAAVIEDDRRTTRVERDAAGTPIAIVSPYGVRTELDAGEDGYLSRVTDAAGQSVALEYAAGGLLTALVDPRGGRHEYGYDDSGRLITDRDPSGAAQTLELSRDGALVNVTRTTPLGRTTRHERITIAAGDEQRTTSPSGALSARIRDDLGNLTLTAADGTLTAITFGADPRFGAMAPLHAESRITLPSGLEMVIQQSRIAELESRADPTSLTRLQHETDINARIYTSEYDAATRTLIETTPAGRQRTRLFDERGRVIETRIPGLLPTFYTYDADGRLTTLTSGSADDARQSHLAYDANGWLSTTTDALDQSTLFVPDPIGRTTRAEYPDGSSINFAYDAASNLIALTPPGQAQHRLDYEARDLLSAYHPPELPTGATPTAYAYDADGAPTSISLPGLAPITYAYDPAGRLQQVQHEDGAIALTYDAADRLATSQSPDGITLAYAYDGPLPSSTTWSGPISGSVTRSYDDNLFVTAITVNETPVAYTHDDDGLITRAGPLTLTHDPGNALLTAASAGDLDATFTHTPHGELATHTVNADGAPLFATAHTYDPLGRIATTSETLEGTTTLTEYAYDSSGRLVTVTTDGTVTAAYTYDPDGNRVAIQQGANTLTATFDSQERLLTQGTTEYAYTERGTLREKTDPNGTTTYEYDPLGNLTAVTLPDSRAITYLTDAQGRRVAKLTDGTLQRAWLYQDNLEPIAELDPNGTLRSRFIYATKPHVPDLMIQEGTTYALITDLRGSVRLVVNTATSEVVQRIDYGPFGEIVADSNPGFQPFGFAGGLYDPDTGLTRFGARDYDALSGRWTSKDPGGFSGGVNLYAYSYSDPVNFIDLDGRIPVPVAIAAFAAFASVFLADNEREALYAGAFAMGGTLVAGAVGPVVGPVARNLLQRVRQGCARAAGGAARGASTVLGRTPQALQKFFTKHGADFGLKGNWSRARAADASRAIHQHINNPAVRAIEGTYRGNPVTHFLDPQTGLNVMAGPGGNFVSGWRLGAEQLESVLTTGRLF